MEIDMLFFFNFRSRFSPTDLDNNGLSDFSLEWHSCDWNIKQIYQAEFVHWSYFINTV